MYRLFLAAALAAAAPPPSKPDPEIPSCIENPLRKSPTLREEGFSVAMANAVATFSGTATKQGSRGGVYAIASTCGASKVINNIVAETPKDSGGSKKE